ncbi:uncharacterized protein LOC135693980 [Rhopilema esculentum]|uniref:uncharacterized protein LOC135693980 n=1 Tax=Rhopilema esculentum TaxID=499914 RepID=UPI0031D19594
MEHTSACLTLLIIAFSFRPVEASPEIGFSARLKSDFGIKRSKWTAIGDWENRGYSLVFEYGIQLDAKKGSAHLPYTGLYFISANIMVSSESKIQIQICVANNVCQTSDQNEHTYFIATQGSFVKHEKLTLRVLASENCFVLKASTFAVQYLGSPSREPGFLAIFPQNRTLKYKDQLGFNTIRGWHKQNIYSKPVSTSNGISGGIKKLAVACDGMYLVTVTLSFYAKDTTYEINLVSNVTEIRFQRSFKYVGFATVTLVKNVNLSKFEELTLQVKSPEMEGVHILAGSRFSAVYIDSDDNNFVEFSQPLKEKGFESKVAVHTITNYVPEWVIGKYNIKKRQQKKHLYSIAVPKHGVYVIMIYLNMKISALDEITANVLVFNEGIVKVTSLYGRPQPVNCDVLPKKYEQISFTVNGVLALEAHDFVSISLRSSCKDGFGILGDSWISFMAVRSHDIAAGFLLRGQPLITDSMRYLQILHLNSSFLNALPLGSSFAKENTEFRSQMRGLYLIALNLVFSRRSSDLKTINIRIEKKTHTPNVLTESFRSVKVFDVNMTVFEGTTAINPIFVHNLEENDLVSFSVVSDGVVSIRETSSLFISLVDFVESGRTFISVLQPQSNLIQFDTKGDHNIENWIPKTSGSISFTSHGMPVAPEDGYYTISCYVEILTKSNVTIPNFGLTLVAYFDDKNMNFGLRDKVEAHAKANGTTSIFLNVIGVLETKKSSRFRTVLHADRLGINATILSGHLSMTFHGKSSHPPETFRTLQSSTKLLSFRQNGWEYLSKRVYENAKGEFKTDDVRFLGLNYYAFKSTVAFVSATTIFHGINGTLEYGVVLLAGSALAKKGLTVEAELNSKTLRTVKWSGLVYMEPWQQLTLAVRMKEGSKFDLSRINARISWSSLSFVALSYPENAALYNEHSNSKEYSKGFEKSFLPTNSWSLNLQCQSSWCSAQDRQANQNQACNTTLSLQRSKPDERNPNSRCLQALGLPRFKLTKTQDLEANFYLMNNSYYKIDKFFSIIETLKSYFSGRSKAACVVGLFSVRLKVSTSSNSLLALQIQTELQNVTLATSMLNDAVFDVMTFNVIICLETVLAVQIKYSDIVNATLVRNSTVSFSLIDRSSNVEGFSAIQNSDQIVSLDKRERTRLDGWSTQHGITCDSSFGFKQPFGSFIAQMSGKYMATANIIVKTSQTSKITVALYHDDHQVPEATSVNLIHNNSVYTINLVALVSAEKWNLLELKLTADQPTSLHIISGSTFSIALFDQDVSLDRCESNLLRIKTSENKERAYRIGADIILTCGTHDSRIVDFYWLRDNKVVDFIPSSRQGVLTVKSASEDDTGIYRCKIATGDFFVVSHEIRVIVYDPRPRIQVSNLTVDILENAPPRQSLAIINVKAATPKDPENGLVRFYIQPAEMQQIFCIFPEKTRDKADIMARKSLDYESRKLYNFTLIAINEDFHGIAKSSVKIQMRIIDQNDNSPEFEKISYEVNLLENAQVGQVVFAAKAKDKDTGINAKVLYSLHNNTDSEYFEIGQESGIITLRKPVAARKRRYFILFVIAENEPFSAFVEVVVRIIDINDNRPYFEPTIYRVNVTETTEVGSIVSKVYAYDADFDPTNRNITFHVLEPAEAFPFKIDGFGNIFIDRKLEALAGKTFVVKVVAFDGQGLASTNKATIILKVAKTIIVPIFSSGLRFSNDVYRIKIREDVSVGSLVTTVKAHNPENSHHQLKYIFIKPENHYYFTISERTGKIFTSLPLDYENCTKHLLTVFACDVDGNSECTAVKVVIDVENVDDNLPKFSQTLYEGNVIEEAEIGDFDLQVNASDKDLGLYGDIRYSIEINDESFPFIIGEKNGVIKFAKKLDILQVKRYVFVVIASSGRETVSTDQALVCIHLSMKSARVNSIQLPVFQKKIHQLSIPENIEPGQQIIQPVIQSPDNVTIRYFILENSNFTFKTNPKTGGVFVVKSLDYETRRSYDLFLIAEINNNYTLRGYTRIRISIIDVNDNQPYFAYQNLETYISGSLKPGRLVTRIRAVDQDFGTNSQMTYSFGTNSTVKEFTLDSETGDLKIKEIGDSREYILPITACDSGVPRQCAFNSMTIHISNNTHEDDLKSSLLDSNYTFVEVEFDVGQYITRQDSELDVRFIAQEVHFSHPYYSQYSQLPPVTWYFVYYRRGERENHLRRFIASQRTFTFQNKSRVRRDISEPNQVLMKFKFGDESHCGEIWKANKICNGPLQPGNEYRFQLEIQYAGSKSFIKTGFTKTFKTGPLVPKRSRVSVVVAKYRFPYWVALVALAGALLFLLLALCVCYCCWARRKRKQKYDVGIQKDSSIDESFLPWKTETESQELTIWFSEESIPNGGRSRGNSNSNSTKL